jgi:hypothetical protein
MLALTVKMVHVVFKHLSVTQLESIPFILNGTSLTMRLVFYFIRDMSTCDMSAWFILTYNGERNTQIQAHFLVIQLISYCRLLVKFSNDRHSQTVMKEPQIKICNKYLDSAFCFLKRQLFEDMFKYFYLLQKN